jgi:hypothetical protein
LDKPDLATPVAIKDSLNKRINIEKYKNIDRTNINLL